MSYRRKRHHNKDQRNRQQDISFEVEYIAISCYRLAKAKRRLDLSQAIKALLESGADAGIPDIKRLVEQNGFEWILGKRFSNARAGNSRIVLRTELSLQGGLN